MSATAERPPRPLETAPPAPVRRTTVGPPRPVRTPAAMAAARRRALASSNIATAARRFGDEYPPARRQWHIRAAGVVLMALMVFYLGWLFAHLAPQHPWLAWP